MASTDVKILISCKAKRFYVHIAVIFVVDFLGGSNPFCIYDRFIELWPRLIKFTYQINFRLNSWKFYLYNELHLKENNRSGYTRIEKLQEKQLYDIENLKIYIQKARGRQKILNKL